MDLIEQHNPRAGSTMVLDELASQPATLEQAWVIVDNKFTTRDIDNGSGEWKPHKASIAAI